MVGVGDRAGLVVVGLEESVKNVLYVKKPTFRVKFYRSQGDQGSVSKFNNVGRA